MNRSTVPHSEIGLRLTICKEFLFDEQKSIEELYGSWMRRIGGQLIEFAEFEYWCRRFQNNQFDLGYDTSQDENAVFGIPSSKDNRSKNSNVANEAVAVKYKYSKFEYIPIAERERKNYRFNVQNVPRYFQSLIHEEKKEEIASIGVDLTPQKCTIYLGYTTIEFRGRGNRWNILYEKKTIPTSKPEKSIIDHLWFVLKDPNIKLDSFFISADESIEESWSMEPVTGRFINFRMLYSMLTAMFDSFEHQIPAPLFNLKGLNEEVFLSIMRKLKPETLANIYFEIPSKESTNCERMKEVVEMDQWKKARFIQSYGVTSLSVDDLLHCERFTLFKSSFTPEDVLRVKEHFFKTPTATAAHLQTNTFVNSDEIEKVLETDSVSTDTTQQHHIFYEYAIPNSEHVLKACFHKKESVSTYQEVYFAIDYF